MFLPIAAKQAESLKGWQEEQETSASPTQKLAHYISSLEQLLHELLKQ